MFKAQIGLTPAQYATGRRAERLRDALAAGESVTGAIYTAGYSAPSRFYAQAGGQLGMAPARARRAGAGERIVHALAEIRLGTVPAAVTERGVCAVTRGDNPAALVADLHHRFAAAELTLDETLGGLLGHVVAPIERTGPAETLPLDLRGTAFQLRVWQALRGCMKTRPAPALTPTPASHGSILDGWPGG